MEYIAGLEYKRTDELGRLRVLVKTRMKAATAGLMPGKYDDNANAIAKVFDKHWPDRKFFIEIGDDNDSWVQVWDARNVFN